MVEAYLFDQRRVLAAAAMMNGEYGLKGIYIGVPVIMGKGGVEKIVEIELNEAEKKALNESADRVRQLLEIL
jgi:malate dehydrogenase